MSDGSRRDSAVRDIARARRAERYRRRDLVWEVGTHARTQQCGRKTTGQTVDHQVVLVHGPHGAGYAGVAYCGSVWACAVCSAVIRTRRAAELMLAAERHLAAGGGLLFVTFKVPHKRRESLLTVLDRLRGGFRAVKRNKAGREALAAAGHVGHVSALEVTDGRHGWHPHLHCLFFLDRPASADRVDSLKAALHAEWVSIAERAEWPAMPTVEGSVDVQAVRDARDASGYVAKVQGEDAREHPLGLEMTRGDLKSGRGRKSLSPFELLDGYADALREKGKRAGRRWVVRWREYEDTMKGRRCIVWSKGMRQRLGLDVEITDEDIANEIAHEDAAELARIDRDLWRILIVTRQRARLLDVAELHGERAVALFLEQARQRWYASERIEPLCGADSP